MNRRTFLATTAAAALDAQTPIPVIDTHIHLYDPARPQGVPWPPKSNTMIYKTTLPSRFREVTKGMGVVGAIEVECSPWVEDNQWVLDVSANEPVIVGTVGNLDVAAKDFSRNLQRFAKNPLFRGVRYGYLWDRDPAEAVRKPEFAAGLRELSRAGLALDTANPSLKLLDAVIRMSDLAPDLRIVLDHLPALYPPADAAERSTYHRQLKELRQRPKVYAKLSAVLRMQNEKKVSYELKDHKDRLDLLCETFGEDRVFYGSDWPNSDPSAPYTIGLKIMRRYFDGKGRGPAEKYFWKNSIAAYRWVHRDRSQPRLT